MKSASITWYSGLPAMQTHRFESSASIAVPADQLFAYLDDHRRLSSHMSQSSWMMAGAQMDIKFDEGLGQKVGSVIRLTGRVLGM